jgi:hypothetical protein
MRDAAATLRVYSTESNAPWHVKPAPNEDIHHQPPGAESCSAASNTKYTKALLKLPYWRSASRL